ncbi:hypothetical protein MITS9509_01365 [Synechococcus sp. MIT S9509]|uniref:hypothetical protein n=1 Tax=Synechococcus sp. MIT S9509 TaxID=1801630 RepID=UPI0007BC011A|nr:hypothetical protein [Synechococcus sp. MIT S9509]KZR92378.1 hypothetical protein MITS9509_01365 [Synechococcus sp. MIT S9509]
MARKRRPKPPHKDHAEDEHDLLNKRHRCNLPEQWDRFTAAELAATQRQARNLVDRGYGFIDWTDLSHGEK